MNRIKIDYGIDLGTTNSAIARMEFGEPVIKKSLDFQKDTVPSCVSVSKKGVIEVGDKALTQLGVDKRQQLKNTNYSSNVFIEFKRTMGSDKTFFSSHLNKHFSSEELSAEILKKLKQPISEEVVNAVVVTVPAKFGVNQKEATKKAAELAGFTQVELLSEPVAAAYTYGIKSKSKDGYWVVFDFGGGTFDAALLKIEEGIFKVISTEGDNYLGGKNIDYAIIDEILLPYFKEYYEIDEIIHNDEKLNRFRNQFKDKAEQLKIALSTKTEEDLISQLGEDFGEDDAGTPFELDLRVTREKLNEVQRPFFQRAVDITRELLKRNNLKGDQIDELILVGGPTLTPLLREMIKEQITENVNNSVDPMTVVAKGAALFASTIDRTDTNFVTEAGVADLEILFDSTTVETDVMINIKCKNYNDFNGEKLFAEVHRSDGAWSSPRIEISQKPKLIDLFLRESMPNNFRVMIFDNKGNSVVSAPDNFTILQGIGDAAAGGVNLPFHYGIEVKNRKTERMVFEPIKGLEKDRITPATGVSRTLTTSSKIRPGMKDDFMRIPLYQGNYNARGSRAIYNDHVFDIEISGEDLPALLPEDSEFVLTIMVDRNEGLTIKANFPLLDYQHELKIDKAYRQKIPSVTKIESEFKDGFKIISDLEKSKVLSDYTRLCELKEALQNLQDYFEKGKNDEDRRKEVFDKMREILIKVDEIDKGTEWERLEKEIRKEFDDLEKADKDLGDEESAETLERIRTKVDEVIRSKDVDVGRDVLEEIEFQFVKVTLIYQLMYRLRHFNDHFSEIKWKNPGQAKQLLNQGLTIIKNNPSEKTLLPILIEMENLLPEPLCNGCNRVKSQCACVS